MSSGLVPCRLLPDVIVALDVASERGHIRGGLKQPVPSGFGPEAPVLLAARPSSTSQQPLRGVDLGGLDAQEVTSTREGHAEFGDLRPRDVHPRLIDSSANAVAQLERVAAVALLERPACLADHARGR